MFFPILAYFVSFCRCYFERTSFSSKPRTSLAFLSSFLLCLVKVEEFKHQQISSALYHHQYPFNCLLINQTASSILIYLIIKHLQSLYSRIFWLLQCHISFLTLIRFFLLQGYSIKVWSSLNYLFFVKLHRSISFPFYYAMTLI